MVCTDSLPLDPSPVDLANECGKIMHPSFPSGLEVEHCLWTSNEDLASSTAVLCYGLTTALQKVLVHYNTTHTYTHAHAHMHTRMCTHTRTHTQQLYHIFSYPQNKHSIQHG